MVFRTVFLLEACRSLPKGIRFLVSLALGHLRCPETCVLVRGHFVFGI